MDNPLKLLSIESRRATLSPSSRVSGLGLGFRV